MAAPATPSAFYKMVAVEEAQKVVLEETVPLAAEVVPFNKALQHVLAEDVLAQEPVPAFRASIKDGYAVVSSDGPGQYDIAFEAFAGAAPKTLHSGTVAYIGTGGPVPEGADAVVQIEDTEFVGATAAGVRQVKILKAAPSGCDIRQVGSDMAEGEVVLKAGHYVGAAEVGILATVGATTVKVHPQPHVAVLSTGDEVCEPEVQPVPAGCIRDSNRSMLLAASAAAGAQATDLGIARDSAEVVEGALDRAIAEGADVLLTTGGVSMGDKDFIKPLLERRGEVFFGKVCMKPGKPLTFAKVPVPEKNRHLLVFGLPGNPVSSLVTFNLVVVPCLRKLQGWQDPRLRRIHVRTTMPISMDPVRPEYYRAVIRWAPAGGAAGTAWEGCSGEFHAEGTGGQISSRLLSLRSANALLEIPQASGTLPAGSLVSALVIGDLAAMPVPTLPPVTALPV